MRTVLLRTVRVSLAVSQGSEEGTLAERGKREKEEENKIGERF